jgi:hypothetical protein
VASRLPRGGGDQALSRKQTPRELAYSELAYSSKRVEEAFSEVRREEGALAFVIKVGVPLYDVSALIAVAFGWITITG